MVDDGTPVTQSEVIEFLEDLDTSGAAAGGGITESEHEDLDTLVHRLSESRYTEVTRTGGLVTSVTDWTDSGKTTKVRECTVSRTGNLISSIVEKQYDGSGTLITGQTLTGTVARTGAKVDTITWVQA